MSPGDLGIFKCISKALSVIGEEDWFDIFFSISYKFILGKLQNRVMDIEKLVN